MKLRLVFALCLLSCVKTFAAEPDAEAKYAQDISKRADDIVALLKIDDAAKATRVHDTIVAQYRALREWHDANDSKVKAKTDAAQVDASRKSLHDAYLAKLGDELTPEQIEIVKDKMTYFKVKVTYDAYCDELPQLTDAQKAQILSWLKDAREEAIDGGSADEKSAIFKKYKGKINNYLSKEGYDMKQAEKEWQDRLKAKRAATTKDSK